MVNSKQGRHPTAQGLVGTSAHGRPTRVLLSASVYRAAPPHLVFTVTGVGIPATGGLPPVNGRGAVRGSPKDPAHAPRVD